METSLYISAICFILQNATFVSALVTTVYKIILLVYLIVRQYIFITTKLKGKVKHL